jgi:hypothetical protein
MIIKLDSVCDHPYLFEELEAIVSGSDYQVDFGARKFEFSDGDNLSIENLKLMFRFGFREIEGTI